MIASVINQRLLAVHRTGSIVAAAKLLGIDKSAVRRTVELSGTEAERTAFLTPRRLSFRLNQDERRSLNHRLDTLIYEFGMVRESSEWVTGQDLIVTFRER